MSYVILWPKMLIMAKFVEGKSWECSIWQEDYIKKKRNKTMDRKEILIQNANFRIHLTSFLW